MKLIKLARRKGKTKHLIEMAHNKEMRIVCLNYERAYNIAEMAQKMGKNITFPVTLNEVMSNKIYGYPIREYLIDDIDEITSVLLYRYLIRPLLAHGNIVEATASHSRLDEILPLEVENGRKNNY